jgi:hypothetical protein
MDIPNSWSDNSKSTPVALLLTLSLLEFFERGTLYEVL